MDNRIILETSPWFILLCFLAGLLYAILLYKQKDPWSKKYAFILAALRFIIVSGITFLLLGPLIKHIRNKVIEPSFVVVFDNSRSIPETYSETAFTGLKGQFEELIDNISNSQLQIQIKDLSGENYKSVHDIGFEATSTNLNLILHEIENEYEGKNLAGVLLISDGIYNRGASPVYSDFGFPIFSLGIGDTTEKEDIILKSLNHNKMVYQGNQFLIQAEIYNKGFAGKPITISLNHKGKMIENKSLDISAENNLQMVNFEVEAKESGIQRYEVIINPLTNEFTTENNILSAYVEVVEGKEKILLLARAPHPDIKALKSLIEKNDNYEIEMVMPGIKAKMSEKYDLAILHQLPDSRNTYDEEIQNLVNSGTPILYILGQNTNISRFNALNHTITIKPLRNQKDNAFVSLNSNFNLFNINETTKNILPELPPLSVPFGEYSLKGEPETVLYQRIGRITTEKPMLIIQKNQDDKEAVLVGEGFWKWRLNEYLITESFDGIDNLFNKIIQYLSVREDRRKFRVYPVRNEYWDNESVIIENEIYNDVYEKIFDQKIDLTLKNERGNISDYSYIISRANSQFRISGLEPGVYQYIAKANLNGMEMTSEGMFSIKKLLIEVTNLKADFGMLKELSRRSSGKFYTVSSLEELSEDIHSSDYHSLIYSTESYLAVINLKWIFFLILLFISLEWGSRKYLGGY
jgi:hypothetical protein